MIDDDVCVWLEFCEECGTVWRTSRRIAHYCARPIDGGSSEESAFCITAE